MAVGLVITIIGFTLCLFAQSSAQSKFPDQDLFNFENKNYEIVDGDHIKRVDFSDTVLVETEEGSKEVKQDIKVLSLQLSNVDSVEIIGRQSSSQVLMYNFRTGLYACEIGSGVITVTNSFKESLLFDYITDIFDDFHGLRKYINFSDNKLGEEKKVIVYINDDDLLNRIDLNLTNCQNVTIKNLTCSLDCKVTLNNSNITFDGCTFKDQEIIYPDPEPVTSTADPSSAVPSSEGNSNSPSLPDDGGNGGNGNGGDGNGDETKPEPTVINHYLTMDIDLRNGSRFTSKNCRFSSVTAVINKKQITQKDIDDATDPTDLVLGSYVSTGGALCYLDMDFSTDSKQMYGFNIYNVPDSDLDLASAAAAVTLIDGIQQPQIYLESADVEDYPQVKINASNCAISIKR